MSFETDTAIGKAAAAIKAETVAHNADYLTCKKDPWRKLIVGYETPTVSLVPGDKITEDHAKQLLLDALEASCRVFEAQFPKMWQLYLAPERAALLELAYYIGVQSMFRIKGFRSVMKRGAKKFIPSLLQHSTDVVRLCKFEPYKQRLQRICKQVETGKFLPPREIKVTPAPKKSPAAPKFVRKPKKSASK